MLNKRTFSGNSPATQPRGRKTHYRPVVVVAANTDYRLMEAIKKEMGEGQIYEHKVSETRPSFNPRKRRQWTYRLNVGQIKTWLPQIAPWLVLKQEQAELLLEVLAIKTRLTPGVGTEWRMAADRDPLNSRMDEIYEQVRELNARGRE